MSEKGHALIVSSFALVPTLPAPPQLACSSSGRYSGSDRGTLRERTHATGKLTHSVPTGVDGSVTFADGRIYALDHRGLMALVRPEPAERAPGAGDGSVVSQFQIPKGGRGPVWAHPVVCGGRLYLRHGDSLFAYDIKIKAR